MSDAEQRGKSSSTAGTTGRKPTLSSKEREVIIGACREVAEGATPGVVIPFEWLEKYENTVDWNEWELENAEWQVVKLIEEKKELEDRLYNLRDKLTELLTHHGCGGCDVCHESSSALRTEMKLETRGELSAEAPAEDHKRSEPPDNTHQDGSGI